MDGLMDNPDIAAYVFADMISRRAQTGWSTHGHSGADVNIYTSDKKTAKALVGNHVCILPQPDAFSHSLMCCK